METTHMVPEPGQEALDFTLEAVTAGVTGPVMLSDYRGRKNVVLAFYVLDWTGG